MTSSCSFRITRTAEDLAQTINALSQRLIKLEQRQTELESQLNHSKQDPPADELKRLDGVDELLRECQELLEASSSSKPQLEEHWTNEDDQENLAA